MGAETIKWYVCAKLQAQGPQCAFNAGCLIWLINFSILLIIQSYRWVFKAQNQTNLQLLNLPLPGNGTCFLSWKANIPAVTQVTVPWKTQGDKSPLQQSPRRRNKLIKLPNGEGRVDLLLISLLLYYPFEKHPLTEITNWRLCGGKSHLSITVVTLPHLSF